MSRLLLFCCFCFLAVVGQAQSYYVHGKITNARLEPLAFATVQVQELQRGTTTKEDGTFEIVVEEGTYHLVFSMVGYKTHMLTIAVTHDVLQNIILEDADENLSEVVVNGKRKDIAEEIIRNVIRTKEKTVSASGPYSCTIYIKATQQDSAKANSPKKEVGVKNDTANARLARMAMAEISLHLDFESATRLKEQRTGVKKEGTSDRLFYLTVTDGLFNFYD